MSVMGANEALPAAAAKAVTTGVIGEYRKPAKVFHWLTVGLVAIMVFSGVMAKQVWEGALADTLFMVHRSTGALTLAVVLLRLCYRIFRSMPQLRFRPVSRKVLHRALYVLIILVPLLGWCGASDSGDRRILFGLSLPAIWPEHAGYEELLLRWHAYLAFGLLAVVALHIGMALQDYMTGHRPMHPDD